jgi:hypothetical protein
LKASGSQPRTTVLIATIGERDPYGQRPPGPPPEPSPPSEPRPTGPLLATLREKPSLVLLLATKGVEPQAQRTRDEIRKELPTASVEIVPLPDQNPAFFDDALAMVEKALTDRRHQLPDGARIVVCPSSGTPQLGLALIADASVLFPKAEFVQALDPRHVPNDEERLRPFDPRNIRLRTDIERALRELEGFNWTVAADILREVLTVRSAYLDGGARPILEAARKLAEAMGKADDFDLPGARDAATPGPNVALRGELDRLKQWFGKAASTDRKNLATLPAELAAAAARLFESERLTRALVTGVTAWEVAIRARLKSACGFDPDNVRRADYDRLPEDLRCRLREVEKDHRWRLEGERNRRHALVELDQFTSQLQHRGDLAPFERLAELRNQLVHTGTTDHDEARRVLRLALQALTQVFECWDWEAWDQAPTAPDSLRKFISKLRGCLEELPKACSP